MVCLGNICRSPLAEGILKSKSNNLKIFVDSAGTAAYHVGSKPDRRSIDIAKQNGIDISIQRARKFEVNDFDKFDVIYAMDLMNYEDILSVTRNTNDKLKVKLILNEISENTNRSVPDPYYGGGNGFKLVFDMLNDACEIIVRKINSNG